VESAHLKRQMQSSQATSMSHVYKKSAQQTTITNLNRDRLVATDDTDAQMQQTSDVRHDRRDDRGIEATLGILDESAGGGSQVQEDDERGGPKLRCIHSKVDLSKSISHKLVRLQGL